MFTTSFSMGLGSRLAATRRGFSLDRPLSKGNQLPPRLSVPAPRAAAPHHATASGLRLYLDSAERSDWEELCSTGIFYGMTTNPVLLERAGVGCNHPTLRQLARAALDDYGVQEFQIQTWGTSPEEMLDNGLEISDIDPSIVVKVPITKTGLQAASLLRRNDVRVTMTGVYTAHQVLSAVAVGAEYAAPYLGRISNKLDSQSHALAECEMMQSIVDSAESPMRILVASIKSAADMALLASQGLDTFTFSPDVAREMVSVPETIQAAHDFEEAGARMRGVVCF